MNIESIEIAAPTMRAPKISWGAVFAGVVAILVTQLLLSVLGIGIGASTINPASEQEPMTASASEQAFGSFPARSLPSLLADGWLSGTRATGK